MRNHDSTLLASIPSPSSGAVDIGPLTIHMYGLTLLAAIGICIWITGHRFVNRGGDWDLIFRCAVWGVGAGIVGARLYHLATSWNEVPDQWWGPFAIWKGGLGVWGGIAVGCLVGGSSRSGPAPTSGCSPTASRPGCSSPRRSAGSATGGTRSSSGSRPSLPWGLEIDPVHRPLATIDHATYHPAFLYELLWNLAAAAFLVYVVERRFHPRPPGLFALYIALYSFGRFWIELVRVDPANHILGLRVNTWVSGLVFVAGLVWFYLSQRRSKPGRRHPRRRRGRR